MRSKRNNEKFIKKTHVEYALTVRNLKNHTINHSKHKYVHSKWSWRCQIVTVSFQAMTNKYHLCTLLLSCSL